MATIEELEARLSQLQGGGTFGAQEAELRRAQAAIDQDWQTRGGGGAGLMTRAPSNYMDMIARRDAAQSQLNAARSGRGANIADVQAQLEAARNRQAGLDLTEGRAQAILDDPRYAAALDALQGAATGETLPFSDEAVGLMQGRFGDLVGAQQEAAQAQLADQMAASGLMPTDPAAQALQRNLTEQGQLARAGNWRDLLIEQAMSNYGAQQQAAAQLGAMRGQQYGLGNPLAAQAAGYYMGTYDEPRTPVAQQYQQPQYQQPQRTPVQAYPGTPTAAQSAMPSPGAQQPTPVQTVPSGGQPAQWSVGGAGAPGSGTTGPVAPTTPYQQFSQPQGPVQNVPTAVDPNAFNVDALMFQEFGWSPEPQLGRDMR